MDPNQTAPQQASPVQGQPQRTPGTSVSSAASAPYYAPAGLKPGHLGGMPSETIESLVTPPEKAATSSYETPITASPEKLSQPEVVPVAETPTNTEHQTENTPTANTPTQPANQALNIVNLTNKKTPLKHLEHSQDTLTSLADQEEEEFIEHVESAHGVK